MFKRILVPLDGSRLGLRARNYATEIAQQFGSEISFLQVLKPTSPVYGVGPAGLASAEASEIAVNAACDEDKKNIARANRYLKGKVRAAANKGIKASSKVVVEFGDAATPIIKFARKENVDLIVMTTHGKSGLKRAILGSVADAVIRESGKPVLTIRPGSRISKTN